MSLANTPSDVTVCVEGTGNLWVLNIIPLLQVMLKTHFRQLGVNKNCQK